MPAINGTLTPADVATHLGASATDPRIISATDASRAWVQTRRCLTDPTMLWADAGIHQGGVLYAALLYQQRSQPQGFPGMDSLGAFGEDTGMTMANVYRLVGADVVVA
jgi:hypothetical protein